MAAGCALLLAILVGYLWGQRGETVESEPVDLVAELDSAQKGQMFRWPRGAKHLPAPHSALRLPAPPHHYSQGMFLEYQPGRIGLLLPEPRESGGPARMTLWDPLEEVVIWEFSFSPPCEERITHKTVGPEVCEAAYFVSLVFHAGTTFDLGEYLVAVLMQDYSPTFVTFVAVQTGELHGYYVHPGQLNRGVVLDLDADGRPELILGGTDNAVNRPALLALHPGPGRRAASTVLWNESGEEGARCRVLFAASPDLAAAAGTARLHVSEVFERSFDLSFRVLTVGVGEPTARSGPTFYHARLGPDLRPLPLAPLVLWDADELALQALGFTDPPLDEWSADILVFEGTP